MAMIVSGPIIESRGWPYVFYFFGFLGFCWCVLWILIGASSASTSKLISQEELDYIQANTTRTAATQKEIPWKTIFSSVHFWALVINYFTNNWGFYIILTWLPTYLEEELHFDLKENTFISFLPYLAQLLVILPVGRIADFMIEKKIKKTTVRRIFQISGSLLPAIFLSSLCLNPSAEGAVILMICGLGASGLQVAGSGVNHLDIGPNYAGVILGISNCVGTLPGIVGVLLTGFILEKTHSWCLVFLITSMIYIFGAIEWMILGTGDLVFP